VRQLRALVFLLLVPQRPGQIVVQVARQPIQPAQEGFVDRKLVEPLGGDLPEQRDGIASDLRPQLRVDGGEQVLSGLVP